MKRITNILFVLSVISALMITPFRVIWAVTSISKFNLGFYVAAAVFAVTFLTWEHLERKYGELRG